MAKVHSDHFVHTNSITVLNSTIYNLTFLILSILTFSSLTSASFAQIRQTIQKLDFEKNSGEFNTLRALENVDMNQIFDQNNDVELQMNSPVRLKTSFSSFFYDQLKKIDNYGCWCSFSDDTGYSGEPGYGKTMDEIDQICKDLRQGYRCAVIDDVTNRCVPWNANYSSSNSLLTDEAQILDACRLDNRASSLNNENENCAIRACSLENTFILEFIKYLVSGRQVNPVFMSKSGFDKKANCKIVKQDEDESLLWARSAAILEDFEYSGSGSFDEEHSFEQIIPDTMCCGEYPKRFPFKTKSGQRACCNKRTYDTSKFECCDGRVAVNCL